MSGLCLGLGIGLGMAGGGGRGPLFVKSQTLLGYWDFAVSAVALNAGNVSQVNDLSSGAHHLTQGTGANQFPFTSGVANPFILGAGASGNHQLLNAAFPVLSQPNTIYLLSNFATPAAVQNAWVDFGATTLHNAIYRGVTATSIFQFGGSNNAIGPVSLGIDAFVQSEYNGVSSRIGYNNVFQPGNAGTTVPTGAGISLGNFFQSANECTGRIYACAIFGGILSAADQLMMKSWGNSRLGLSM